MQHLIILHSNDLHGRVEGLAWIATLVASLRADHPDAAVLYFDAGDSEEASRRLSNITKGTAMHRLLSAAGCAGAAVGNAAPMRYGPDVLLDHARAARYPLLLANLRDPDGVPLPGVQPTAVLRVGALRLGLIGVTAPMDGIYEQTFNLRALPVVPLIRELMAALYQDGADLIVLLSHLGLPDDREVAAAIPDLPLIIGAHTHDLLPQGERVGSVMIAQAGEYAEHLGRIDVEWDGEEARVVSVSVLPITDALPQAPAVLTEIAAIETDLEHFLAEQIGELAAPLDFAPDRECGVGNLMADMLRERMQADVGVISVGQAFTDGLPGGRLLRGKLWDVCTTTANPGVATLTGSRLAALVERGLDPQFAADRPRPLRGQARGLLHLSGLTIRDGLLLVDDVPLDPQQEYRVAGSDWELEPYGGYVDPSWSLQPTYDVPIILREALEEYLAGRGPVIVTLGRLGQL